MIYGIILICQVKTFFVLVIQSLNHKITSSTCTQSKSLKWHSSTPSILNLNHLFTSRILNLNHSITSSIHNLNHSITSSILNLNHSITSSILNLYYSITLGILNLYYSITSGIYLIYSILLYRPSACHCHAIAAQKV